MLVTRGQSYVRERSVVSLIIATIITTTVAAAAGDDDEEEEEEDVSKLKTGLLWVAWSDLWVGSSRVVLGLVGSGCVGCGRVWSGRVGSGR